MGGGRKIISGMWDYGQISNFTIICLHFRIFGIRISIIILMINTSHKDPSILEKKFFFACKMSHGSLVASPQKHCLAPNVTLSRLRNPDLDILYILLREPRMCTINLRLELPRTAVLLETPVMDFWVGEKTHSYITNFRVVGYSN